MQILECMLVLLTLRTQARHVLLVEKIDTELNLTKRIYNCGCGLSISRDYNACLNIVNKI